MKIGQLKLSFSGPKFIRVKAFPENIPFSGNAIFRKGKYFHVFGYISKNFLKNIFCCLEKKKEKTNPEEGRRDHTAIVEIAIDGAIDDCDRRAHSLDDRTARRSCRWSIDECARRTIVPLVDRCSPIWALSSLSLSSDLGSLFSLSLSLSLFPEMN